MSVRVGAGQRPGLGSSSKAAAAAWLTVLVEGWLTSWMDGGAYVEVQEGLK